jgi:RNA polymerase sigma factor (sigma-70 family)
LLQKEEDIHKIIDGCKRDDRMAQEQLYRSYYRVMMNLCLRYTKNETDALAALNMGFLKVFRNIQRYDSRQASLYTWIRTVVINSCLDHIKLKQKEIKSEELSHAEEIQVVPEIIRKIKAGEILNMVRKLPPATQAVFNLFVIEGYGHKEIGELLHISDGTSKWHLSEARKLLKQLIKQQVDNS